MSPSNDPRVLVDFRTGDDAGVFRLDDERALVQTVDFLTPVVDDPEAFGAIAAANALSDVFAMGGEPITALAIAGLPEHGFPLEWTAAIFRGGLGTLREAGCALLGGHTVRDPEIKFGYAVTGLVHPARVLTNAGARPDDLLYLTKALGTGVLATAQKHDRLPAPALDASTRSMRTLNRIPTLVRPWISAATDVTGFGLAGHATAIARESGVSLTIEAQALPLLPEALELATVHAPGGLLSNRARFESDLGYAIGVPEALRALLFDPQTSGGLLLTVPARHAAQMEADWPAAKRIGRVTPRRSEDLTVA